MNWKEELIEIEKDFGFHKHKDWKPDINLVNKLLIKYPEDVDLNIRAIYFLHNILLEEEYSNEEQITMVDLLQEWFNQSKEKFSGNTEYLFFIGKILHIAEWYFGLESNILALEFQKKAMEREPGNLLYEWAYRFSCSENITESRLAHQLITNEKDKVKWLKSKGFPGDYILEQVEISNQEYLDNIT